MTKRLLDFLLLLAICATADAEQFYVGAGSGLSTAPFATADISSSHARWQGDLSAGYVLGPKLSAGLRIGYSPAAEISVDGNGASAHDLIMLGEVNFRHAFSNTSMVFYGVQAGGQRAKGSANRTQTEWYPEYGLLLGVERAYDPGLAAGLRLDTRFYNGAAVQFLTYLNYYFEP